MTGILTRIVRRLGRLVEPLIDPDAADRRRREEALTKQIEAVGGSLSRLAGQVERLTQRVDKIDRRQIDHLDSAVAALRLSTKRQATLAERVAREAHRGQEHEFTRERVLRRLHHVARRGTPLLVGPWTGEVGFELLYWAPFVRWAIHRFGVDPATVTLLSRGRTASWYGLDGARYIDVFDLRSPAEFREQTAAVRKQRRLRLFDRALLREVARSMEQRPGIVHPAMMYALFMPYWKQQQSRRWVEDFSEFARITPPAVPGLQLPRDYVAVRFYFSDCFPDTAANRALIDDMVRSLSAETHVVVLGSGTRVDDHHDFSAAASERVHTVDHLMTPANNLAVQTAVLAGARAFVGTYGGFSYLAPLCGVNTVALYSRRTFFVYHMDFAQAMFDAVGGGSLTVVDATVTPLMRALAARGVESK
ncbi:MAG: hypothetical protein FJW14_09795 [Acidimicrobiia bacterium]|nr:hypothetical protein [Acidimicrobiia bacterium]